MKPFVVNSFYASAQLYHSWYSPRLLATAGDVVCGLPHSTGWLGEFTSSSEDVTGSILGWLIQRCGFVYSLCFLTYWFSLLFLYVLAVLDFTLFEKAIVVI